MPGFPSFPARAPRGAARGAQLPGRPSAPDLGRPAWQAGWRRWAPRAEPARHGPPRRPACSSHRAPRPDDSLGDWAWKPAARDTCGRPPVSDLWPTAVRSTACHKRGAKAVASPAARPGRSRLRRRPWPLMFDPSENVIFRRRRAEMHGHRASSRPRAPAGASNGSHWGKLLARPPAAGQVHKRAAMAEEPPSSDTLPRPRWGIHPRPRWQVHDLKRRGRSV
jgi:hypothetical protein